ncbi:hypothetical protein ABPG72_001072 [Tetrahymena utriculariae]
MFIFISDQTLSTSNYSNCQIQSTQLQGLKFQTVFFRLFPIYIFIESDLDTIIITSQNRLNIFQLSTLNYLGTQDYGIYYFQEITNYYPLSNALYVQQQAYAWFQLFELWTPLFTNLYSNSFRSYKSRFIFDQESNTALYLNYNSNHLEVISSQNNQILHQFKFNQSLSVTQYFVQLYKLSESIILAITSDTELVIYDFIQNQQIKQVSSSFKCIMFSNYSSDIFCLEKNNILKKFDQTSLNFVTMANQANIQIEVSEFHALSQQVIAFISFNGQMVLLNPQTLQVSDIISSLQQVDKIQQVGHNKNTLIIAESASIYAYNLQSNKLIGNLPIPCQKDIMHLYLDLFAFILYNDLILVNLNSQSSKIVETFMNLDYPQIYQVNLIAQNQLQKTPYQIQLKCYSDSNLFNITHFIETSSQTSDTLINFVQSPSIFNNIFQHNDLQNRASSQQLNLKKYIIQMSLQYSKLEQIQIFNDDIFTQQTAIEYQFNIQMDKLKMKGIANLTDSSFVQKQFCVLSFQTIILQISTNESNFVLNQYNNLKSLKFNDVDFVFDKNSKSNLLISNLNTLILDYININDQEINGLYDTIINLTINKGNLFQITKSNIVQLFNLNATQVKSNSQSQRILHFTPFQKQRIIQDAQQNEISSLLNFQGCYNTSLQDLQFDHFNEITFLQSNHFAVSDQFQYYSNLISIEKATLKQIQFSLQKNPIFSITSLNAQMKYINFTNINSLSNLITLNIQNQMNILNSLFTNTNILDGSVIMLTQGKLQLVSSSFINITSTGQGGGIAIQNSKQTLIENCQFQNCISLNDGGAIYSSQQTKGNLTILRSNFIENQSIQGSGGAAFLQELSGINITKSNFTKNQALNKNGGAISFISSYLLQFTENTFSFNEAVIGGSIYHDNNNSTLLNKTNFLQNQIIFQLNKAYFYGQNIGSDPKYIGITNQPDLGSLKIAQEYFIDNIASGNHLDQQKLYLNFIDEENNPLNFLGPDTQYNRKKFQFMVDPNNSQIIIQEGINARLNNNIGMFELNFQSFYKESQNQTIFIISNYFLQKVPLSIPLYLHFRNCIVGEIIQESSQYIACNQCVQGRYSLKIPDMQKDVNKLQCVSCPEQAQSCQGSEINLNDGYWRESNLTDQIYTCLLDGCSFQNPKSKAGCLTGYIGPLCNSCDSKQSVWGEQHGLKNKKCSPCSEQLSQISYVCFFILFYVFYITISQQKIMVSQIKILSISSQFGIFNQHLVSNSLNLFGDPTTMTVSSFDCLFKISDKYPLWLNRILTQLFSILFICLLTLTMLLISLILSYQKREKAYKQFPTTAKMTLIFFYIFYQPSISKVLIQGLICIKIGSKYYLTSDYSQECYDYYHLLYSLVIIVPLIIIFCFLIPYFLFSKLKYLQKKDQQDRLIYSKVGSVMTYGFLYIGYKKEKKIIQNLEGLELQSYISSTNVLFNQINIQKDGESKNQNLLPLFSPQKQKLIKEVNSQQSQECFNNQIGEIKERQEITSNLKPSINTNDRDIQAVQSPNQLENSNHSGLIFENELNYVQIGQNFIFDNMITANKFQQTKLDKKVNAE